MCSSRRRISHRGKGKKTGAGWAAAHQTSVSATTKADRRTTGLHALYTINTANNRQWNVWGLQLQEWCFEKAKRFRYKRWSWFNGVQNEWGTMGKIQWRDRLARQGIGGEVPPSIPERWELALPRGQKHWFSPLLWYRAYRWQSLCWFWSVCLH